MSYKVKLREFEGPFDLLVYLIENSEMSIYDIRISEITGEYLEYLSTMKEMNVSVSSEFLVLAAELLNIKSRMMLPHAEPDAAGVVLEDPRNALVERLIAYKRCKMASIMLGEQAEATESMLEKLQEDISEYLDNPDEYLSLGLADFARAFNQFLIRKQRIEETRRRYTRIERERETMESRMVFIRDTFVRALDSGDMTEKDFRDLIPPLSFHYRGGADGRDPDRDPKELSGVMRYNTIVSFTSLLQMMRDRYLDAEQKETYGHITVRPGEIDIHTYNAEAASNEAIAEETADQEMERSGDA
ncbi:MAG: segregation/condensation protein A [Eubacterium sp.]|nr:segregation/condensation protein A [Eubacterium sp.]